MPVPLARSAALPRTPVAYPTRTRPRATQALVIVALLLLLTAPAWSGGAGLPWEGPLQNLVDSLTGPVAKAIGVTAVLGCGVGIAFSEGGSMMRKALWVAVGVAIAFNASSFAMTFFNFAGGLLV